MVLVLLRLPSRKVNALVYARVSLAHKDMEPELECFDAQTRKAEGFGELKGGFLVRCSLKMSRKCVSLVLATLAHENVAVSWIQTTSCYLCSDHAFLWMLRLVRMGGSGLALKRSSRQLLLPDVLRRLIQMEVVWIKLRSRSSLALWIYSVL